MIETYQNTPKEINLLALVNDNGWSFSGDKVIHESCNAGVITYSEIFKANFDYTVTLNIESISGGYLEVRLGNDSEQFTTAGFKTLTLNSTTVNPKLALYSNANCVVQVLTIKQEETPEDIDEDKTDTIVYSLDAQKWTRYDNYYPDFGFSMFTTMYTFKDGVMYSHNDTENRNTFYGEEFKSRIEVPFSSPMVKTFQSLKIESNKLLITTTDGIQTSLGHVSDLIGQDFEQFTLDDGITTVTVYDKEGNFTANFLRDKNTDINFGDRLKGRYITVKLTTTDDQDFKLYKVIVKFAISTPNE